MYSQNAAVGDKYKRLAPGADRAAGNNPGVNHQANAFANNTIINNQRRIYIMKCQNCGNHEANFHYSQNINGAVTEQHLCGDCAERLGYAGGFFKDPDASIRSLVNDFFAPRISEPSFPSFHSFFSPSFPAAFRIPSQTAEAMPAAAAQGTAAPQIDETLKKRREVNILREQMRAAAEREDFEKAAEIRDQIRQLENV
jgi:protein arginine kinase activator